MLKQTDPQIKKGIEGEAFVNQIAFKSFIRFWCYPSPLDITGDGKEICDLLVVFNSICIIISVKNYEFKEDYTRYFKKTTEKAIRQINGAERKLFGDRAIILKHPDRKDVVFDKKRIKEVYRIVVNLNSEVKYYKTSIFENERNYSVMDAEAWEGAMSIFNSLPDFINYITCRCQFFSECSTFIFPRSEYDFDVNSEISSSSEIYEQAERKKKIVIILGSEMDLIAFYVQNIFSFPDDNKLEKDYQTYVFKLDGAFRKYRESEAYEVVNDYEKESYFIDALVQDSVLDHEHGYLIAEMLLKLNRLDRAEFARCFLEFHNGYKLGDPTVSMHASHVVVCRLPMIFVYYTDKCSKDEIDTFIYNRIMHYHYLSDFKIKELGVLGMSKVNQKFVYGYSRLETQYTIEEIKEMETDFKNLGWKLKSDVEIKL